MLSAHSRSNTTRTPVSSPTYAPAGHCSACGRRRLDRARCDVVAVGTPVALCTPTRNASALVFGVAPPGTRRRDASKTLMRTSAVKRS